MGTTETVSLRNDVIWGVHPVRRLQPGRRRLRRRGRHRTGGRNQPPAVPIVNETATVCKRRSYRNRSTP
jgi:hypothetical protein